MLQGAKSQPTQAANFHIFFNREIFSAKSIFFLIIIFCGCASEQRTEGVPAEIKEGNIHLVLNDSSPTFSLFYLADPAALSYEPLFNGSGSLASYASISINGKVHKLSDRIFRQSIQIINKYPAYIFESSALTVTQMFTPVITLNSIYVNGIMITYLITNTSDSEQNVGLRVLFDTILGEGRGNVPFILDDSREINNETLIDGNAGEKFWTSRNSNLSLMGSIINPLDSTAKIPDSVYFAGWKRFYNAAWNFNVSHGRTFEGDSAVCYFYNQVPVESGASVSYTIFLTSEDTGWYLTGRNAEPEEDSKQEEFITAFTEDVTDISFTDTHSEEMRTEEPALVSEDANIEILQMLQSILRQFINGEIDLSEQDLLEIENAIRRHR